ncbi:sensor histidine kinase [Georgenia yuyongxinii]|uniref:histidine kinase n=1 Tax=Georgenia yuyongxinii TaxID=2589797 RepID=A0A552WLA1_9MICO|nr:ATP-binding protein [Georgenia yuyongxinii]TRW43527.1 hypothetical protein FJ693_17250 [Georgenia yuyongxinii]
MSSADLTARLAARGPGSLETASITGAVQFVCDARLATLAALVVLEATARPSPLLVVLLLAIPFSWLPLRYWAARPQLFSDDRRFLLSDALMTLVVAGAAGAAGAGNALTAAYVLVSAALLGILLPRWRALAWAVVVSAGCLLAGSIATPGRTAPEWLLLVPAAAFLSHLSGRLGQALRRQGRLAGELIELRTRKAAVGERAALAREMHDSLAKTLHGVRMLTEVLAERLHADGSAHAGTADVIFDACDTATREAREVLGGLRALARDQLGDAVRLEARLWHERTGIPVDLQVQGEDTGPTDAEASWRAIRILGELLENIHRHAGASRATVTVRLAPDALDLVVADDGRGLPPLDHDALALGGHYGLIGVRERAAEVGGCVTVSVPPGGTGTQIHVHLPAVPQQPAPAPTIPTGRNQPS